MDIVYYIEADFDCAFLINGAFREQAGLFKYPASSPLYVTVLPLSAVLLPYTVKVVGGRTVGNENIAGCYAAGSSRYILKLKARHNYVYSPVAPVSTTHGKGAAHDLFIAVKSGDTSAARALMTGSLSASIDNESLLAFFSAYSDIIANRFSDIGANYLLVAGDKKCEAFNFAFSGNLIDNIEQIDFSD